MIDDATIKRVAEVRGILIPSNQFTATCMTEEMFYVFARAVEQLARQEQREETLRIARGCTDYGGGYRSNQEQYDIYQHGIQTVISALTAASNNGLGDTQVAALYVAGEKGEGK